MPGQPDVAVYAWCSLTDVANITGAQGVSQQSLDLARDAIEFATGAIESVNRVYLSRRDYYFLRQAVAYQAVWIQAQPDYLTRDDVASFTQDGVTINGTPDRVRLAPLARSACRRLSWKGTRSIAPRVPLTSRPVGFEGNVLAGNTSPLPQYIGGDPTLDGSDDTETWSGM